MDEVEDYNEATKYFSKALEIRKSNKGRNHE